MHHQEEIHREVFEDALLDAGLINRQLKLFRTSPLFNVDRESISNVALVLRRELFSNNEECYVVNVESLPDLRRAFNITPALQIQVLAGNKPIYTGTFMNLGEVVEEECESKENLPFLAVQGSAKIISTVHTAMVRLFDCVISPLELNSRELVRAYALMVMSAQPQEKGMASLKYNIPGLPPSESITIKAEIAPSATIFKYLNNPPGENEFVDIIFYTKIIDNFKSKYHLDFANANLVNVALPDGSVSIDGSVLLKTPLIAYLVLCSVYDFLQKTSLLLPREPALSIPSNLS